MGRPSAYSYTLRSFTSVSLYSTLLFSLVELCYLCKLLWCVPGSFWSGSPHGLLWEYTHILHPDPQGTRLIITNTFQLLSSHWFSVSRVLHNSGDEINVVSCIPLSSATPGSSTVKAGTMSTAPSSSIPPASSSAPTASEGGNSSDGES